MRLSTLHEVSIFEYIVKSGKGYCVKSEKGKNLGCKGKNGKPYTKAQAKKRLAQIEYFKHKG
jgi:hypothetical protein